MQPNFATTKPSLGNRGADFIGGGAALAWRWWRISLAADRQGRIVG